jgi:hypothetical protein
MHTHVMLIEARLLATDRLTNEGDGREHFLGGDVVVGAPAVYRSGKERSEGWFEPEPLGRWLSHPGRGSSGMTVGGSVQRDGSAIFIARCGLESLIASVQSSSAQTVAGLSGPPRQGASSLPGILSGNVAYMQPRARPERQEVDLPRLAAGFGPMAPNVAMVGEVTDREALQRISRHAGWSGRQLMRRGRSGWLDVDTAAGDYP